MCRSRRFQCLPIQTIFQRQCMSGMSGSLHLSFPYQISCRKGLDITDIVNWKGGILSGQAASVTVDQWDGFHKFVNIKFGLGFKDFYERAKARSGELGRSVTIISQWNDALTSHRSARAAMNMSQVSCLLNPLEAKISTLTSSTRNNMSYLSFQTEPAPRWSHHTILTSLGCVHASFMGNEVTRNAAFQTIRAAVIINLVGNTAAALPVIARGALGVTSCVAELYGCFIVVGSRNQDKKDVSANNVAQSLPLKPVEDSEEEEPEIIFLWSSPCWGWQRDPDRSAYH
jgi:hypothetical protein